MRYAVTDVGANTVKISLYEVENRRPRHIVSQSTPVGLAGYVKDGAMSEEGISALAGVLADYRRLADMIGASEFFCLATASLRHLVNRTRVVFEIRQRTGVPILVIDGEREAELGFIGFSDAVRTRLGGIPSEGLFIDMGGGSTEFASVGDQGCRKSLAFGALSLYNRFVTGILPDGGEGRAIADCVAQTLKEGFAEERCGGRTAYITGGTAKALGKLISEFTGKRRGSGAELAAEDFACLLRRLERQDKGDLHRMAGKLPDRLHMLLPGLYAFHEIFRFFGTERVYTVYSGIRDGFILDGITKGLIC